MTRALIDLMACRQCVAWLTGMGAHLGSHMHPHPTFIHPFWGRTIASCNDFFLVDKHLYKLQIHFQSEPSGTAGGGGGGGGGAEGPSKCFKSRGSLIGIWSFSGPSLGSIVANDADVNPNPTNNDFYGGGAALGKRLLNHHSLTP